MGYGDELMAAGVAQRVYDVDPSKRVAICTRVGEPRWHVVWDHNPILATPADVAAGESVHRIRNAPGCRPYLASLTVEHGARFTDWRARDSPPRIVLTPEERAIGARLRDRIGPYVIVEPHLKAPSSPNKQWPVDRYAAVVSACADQTWVQMPQDRAPLAGVVVVQAPSFRTACGVLASATAYLGPEGGLHHACAALGVPAVVIFGGFISPTTTGYPSHVNVADDGPGSPCGSWRPCAHCAAAMNRITGDRVVDALRGLLARQEVAA